MTNRNLTRTSSLIARQDRSALLGQRGAVVWFTGLSGSGKSTLAYAVERELIRMGHLAYVLDGDNIRLGLNADLGFSPSDRNENIRRVGEVAALMSESGMFVLTSFISPYIKDRAAARDVATERGADFIEVYIDVPVSVCESRDPKGLYKRARAGDIPNFTGISSPYEAPMSAELRVDTASNSLDTCINSVIDYLRSHNYFTSPEQSAEQTERTTQ